MTIDIIGDNPRRSRYDPNLANEFNKQVEDEERRKKLEEKLGKAKLGTDENPKIEVPTKNVITHVGVGAPEDYIFLEGRSHEDYSYSDLDVCKYKLGASSDVQKAGQGLGIALQNTAKEQNGRDYAGNINHGQALRLNLALGGLTLNVRQFVDFLNLLKSGKAFDGKGNKVNKKELENIFNEITEVRNPGRYEWLDGDFKTENDRIYICTSHVLDASGNLAPQYKRELTDSLMQDKTPGIDLNDWLANANQYGLPRSNIKDGKKLYYWAPDKDNNSVAGFGADSGWADLDCYRDRDDADDSLGVRHARSRVRKIGGSS